MRYLVINIAGTPSGTYGKLKVRLKGMAWVYDAKTFVLDGLDAETMDSLAREIELDYPEAKVSVQADVVPALDPAGEPVPVVVIPRHIPGDGGADVLPPEVIPVNPTIPAAEWVVPAGIRALFGIK